MNVTMRVCQCVDLCVLAQMYLMFQNFNLQFYVKTLSINGQVITEKLQ